VLTKKIFMGKTHFYQTQVVKTPDGKLGVVAEVWKNVLVVQPSHGGRPITLTKDQVAEPNPEEVRTHDLQVAGLCLQESL
jgi:hypothetical protein